MLIIYLFLEIDKYLSFVHYLCATHEKCFRSVTYEVPLQLQCKRMQALDGFPRVWNRAKNSFNRTVSIIL